MKMDLFRFYLLRMVIWPFSLLPYGVIHFLGRRLGTLSYYLLTNFRKRTLSNISLATDLKLSPKEVRKLAKKSFQNLMITCLEYPKLSRETDISNLATCENPETALELLKDGKGILFFCGHQSNWEVLFLEGTSRMPGVAIGRPVKNPYLYDWVLSIRQKFGGSIITPRSAIKEGLRALKQGKFLGIVGDQGMPDSGYSSSFMGRTAWTSPIPAILAYRSGRPILVAMTLRKEDRYVIRYSEPLWPDLTQPMEVEIDRLMKKSLRILEDSIKEHPDQWLWQHNRWKQELPGKLIKPFRQESLCVILPETKEELEPLLAHLATFRKLYPKEFITFFVPKSLESFLPPLEGEVIFYDSYKDLLLPYYQFKLVFNLTKDKKIAPHFLNKLSAFAVVDQKELTALSGLNNESSFSDILTKALSHAG